MREIKFRAWDKKEKRMLEVVTLYRMHPDGHSVRCRGKIDLIEGTFELMQYTGLKDKNERHEIYEDDFLRKRSGVIYRVVWNQIYCRFELETIGGGPVSVRDLAREENTEWEVIGNIYENSDLLK